MKKLVAALAVIFALMMAAPAAAEAGDRPDGFGLGLGTADSVQGVSGKVHTGDTAIQGVLGRWWGGWGTHWGRTWTRRNDGLGLSVDVLVHMDTIHEADAINIGWNIGGGGAIGLHPDWDPRLQGQFVAGLEFFFPDVPLDVAFEWRPGLLLSPGWGFSFGGAGAHVRFYLD